MSPNREAQHVATCAVKPSVVVVPTCKTAKDNRFAQGVARGVAADAIALVTSSRTVAWNPASKGIKARNTARGGACEPRRVNKFRSGESRLSIETPTTRTATSARSVQFLFFQPTKHKKESNMMNKIMVSLFAVILAAFAVSAVMRERVKADAACHAVEVAR